jgi:hypothetical protein
MSKLETQGRLSVYLRGGGVIDLPKGNAQVEVGDDGKAKSINLTNEGDIEVVWLDPSEVVAIVKEGTRFR